MSRATVVLRRLLGFLISVLVASFVVFALLNLLPGDVAGVIAGTNGTPEAIEAIRERLGLDRPFLVRYGEWLWTLVNGQFAISVYTSQSVASDVVAKLGVTCSLVFIGMAIALIIAMPTGMFAAMRRNRPTGMAVTALSQLGMAIPVFVLGVLLSLVLGVHLRVLPANGYVPMRESFSGWLRHIILPAITLGLVQSAVLVRYVKNAFIDVIGQDYYRTARAIGWRRWRALARHGMRNASLQIVTVLGLQLSTLFVGAIVVENVFALAGLGSYLLDMVARRDLPVVASVVIVLVSIVLVINLLVDLAYALIDPRVRVSGGEDE